MIILKSKHNRIVRELQTELVRLTEELDASNATLMVAIHKNVDTQQEKHLMQAMLAKLSGWSVRKDTDYSYEFIISVNSLLVDACVNTYNNKKECDFIADHLVNRIKHALYHKKLSDLSESYKRNEEMMPNESNPLDCPNLPFDAGYYDFGDTYPRGIVTRYRAGFDAAITWLVEHSINFVARTYNKSPYEFLVEYDLPIHMNDRTLAEKIVSAIDASL